MRWKKEREGNGREEEVWEVKRKGWSVRGARNVHEKIIVLKVSHKILKKVER